LDDTGKIKDPRKKGVRQGKSHPRKNAHYSAGRFDWNGSLGAVRRGGCAGKPKAGGKKTLTKEGVLPDEGEPEGGGKEENIGTFLCLGRKKKTDEGCGPQKLRRGKGSTKERKKGCCGEVVQKTNE